MEIVTDEKGSENSKDKDVKLVNNVPEWILTEVLTTMPMKLVFRSKLVSKHWLSVVSDPSFAITYTLRASLSQTLKPWTFIFGTMYVDGSQGWDFSEHRLLGDMYTRGVTPSSLYVVRCPSAQHLDTKRYMILGVNNGLVLYGPCIERDCVNSIEEYSICNPITGQWITLPPHARHFKIVSSGFVTRVENSALTSYRVVRFDMFFRKSDSVMFEVFSSETGKWEEFEVCVDREIQVVWPGSHTCLNGILHWTTRENGIIAYDPYHNPRCVRIIALPGDVHSRNYFTTHIGTTSSVNDVHQEQLRCFQIANVFDIYSHGFSRISIWVLKDYSTGDWYLQHKIDSSSIIKDQVLKYKSLCLKPLSFHPFDSDIVYLRYKNIIVSYNMKSRKLEANGSSLHVEGHSISNNTWPSWASTFMFVVPPWPICIPRPLLEFRLSNK